MALTLTLTCTSTGPEGTAQVSRSVNVPQDSSVSIEDLQSADDFIEWAKGLGVDLEEFLGFVAPVTSEG